MDFLNAISQVKTMWLKHKCLFSQNAQIFRVSDPKYKTTGPCFLSVKAKAELTDRHPSLCRTCAQSWDAAAEKSNKHWNFEAR